MKFPQRCTAQPCCIVAVSETNNAELEDSLSSLLSCHVIGCAKGVRVLGGAVEMMHVMNVRARCFGHLCRADLVYKKPCLLVG